jgi:hypothetical protein
MTISKGRKAVKFLKSLLPVFAVLMILMGGLWIGQGLNFITWPENSFMIGVPQWSWSGMFMIIAGIALLWWPRRK